jgi:hypothetical protein
MSADEQEVQSGRLQKRVTNLATSGRITKEEYDALASRLQRD